LAVCTPEGGCICVPGFLQYSFLSKPYCVFSDIDECLRTLGICGPDTDCTNTIGSYICTCSVGFSATNSSLPPGSSNQCEDIDECLQNVCGNGICSNNPGSYDCKCNTGYQLVPNATTVCQDVDECSISGICGPLSICTNMPGTYSCACQAGYTPTQSNQEPIIVPSLDLDECSTSTVCGPDSVCTNTIGNYSCACQPGYTPTQPAEQPSERCGDWQCHPGHHRPFSFCNDFNTLPKNQKKAADVTPGLERVSYTVAKLHLNSYCSLFNLASSFYPSFRFELRGAAVAFMTLNGMESLLSHQYFKTESQTEMYSDVLTAVLLPLSNTIFTKPVNFTIRHKDVLESGSVTCVYWDDNVKQWSVVGCWVAQSDENYTVCSCSHLSTFALIMQIGEVFQISIYMLHVLILEIRCFHSFVWMQLEALQLHLLVRRLSKVQVIQRDGLPRPILYLIGYGVPFVIVGVSALVYSDGYGATDAKVCWLSTQRHFNWALTGPVIVILALNLMLFCATLWSLRPTLANMKSDVSQSKDTRLILFKIVAQFVILGCTWILGLYQTNLFFQVLFIILNSQQGTLLYIVHCLLNKEVREEYIKWLTCSFGKDSTAVRSPLMFI
uniref:Adhesion G protein-coupled receptor E8 n=1 Tax=Anabas testudineus TaxID=64144 RepID=A0A3Q1JLU3_ANATE